MTDPLENSKPNPSPNALCKNLAYLALGMSFIALIGLILLYAAFQSGSQPVLEPVDKAMFQRKTNPKANLFLSTSLSSDQIQALNQQLDKLIQILESTESLSLDASSQEIKPAIEPTLQPQAESFDFRHWFDSSWNQFKTLIKKAPVEKSSNLAFDLARARLLLQLESVRALILYGNISLAQSTIEKNKTFLEENQSLQIAPFYDSLKAGLSALLQDLNTKSTPPLVLGKKNTCLEGA